MACFVFFGGAGLTAFAQEQEGAEVQTRGPVHEAFAGIVTYNPEPGVVVTKAPPEPIEEIPPDEKPDGENVTWIPGYWGWDDERKDYLWISGTWRALPPGRAWIAGYWAQTGQGHQWTSGYWADSAQRESTYQPAPPATIEAGPNVAAPSPDYIWMPGCWMWSYNHYAWRPGYWAVGRPDWDWIPAHYIWSPRGYILVGGYWDYPVERRGVLFAPVFFAPHIYARRHYVFAPSIVINLGVFSDHLFCRPRYHHYYFGDYYAPLYVSSGFYASFSFHLGRHGYDPIYSHHRWHHRHDRDWQHSLEVSYRNRRDHEDARPPRTWVQQRNVTITQTRVENRVVVGSTFDQYRRRTDSPVRYRTVDSSERQTLVQRNREVQSSRDQRRTLEAGDQATAAARPTEARPVRAPIPKSTIVAKPVRELAPKDAPPSPQHAPRLNSTIQQTREPGRPNREEERNRSRVRDRDEPRPGQPVPPAAPGNPQRQFNPQPERSLPAAPPQERTRPAREPVQTTPQPERRVVPTPPQAEQRAPVAPRQERAIPSTPQSERREVTPPQREQRAPVAPPQARSSQPQPERRAPQAERRAPPGQVQSAAPAPDNRGGPSQRPANPRSSEQKGAERLKEHGKKDR